MDTDKYKPLHKNTVDITGKKYGDWEVLGYLGKSMWECKCTCGTIKAIDGRSLRKGITKSCGHEAREKQDLTNKQFGEWNVLEYAEYRNKRHYWKCKCSCGKEAVLDSFTLTSGNTKSCGHDKLKDITGKEFGDLKVIKYIGKGMWECECLCGNHINVDGKLLRNGQTKSCGHRNQVENIIGKRFGVLEVIEYRGSGLWACKCECGRVISLNRKQLESRINTGCKHEFKNDLTNRQFGEWTALEYIGNRMWKCRCLCGTIRNVSSQALLMGTTRSCGCKKYDRAKETLLARYGDTATCRTESPREEWQLAILESKEVMEEYLKGFEIAPTSFELEQLLNTNRNVILKKIHKYELDSYVNIRPYYSQSEIELLEYIKSITSKEIIRNDRSILKGKELDILIPELSIAIEFNGTYWHSDEIKDKKYHQNKTLECAKAGIRLIHLFEYEWVHKDKVKSYLKNIIGNEKEKIGARKCELVKIDNKEAMLFEELYHIGGSASASINIGLKYNGELVAIMTFGTPRFDSRHEYELIRYCCKNGIALMGGAERLFKQFIKEYRPESIVCYTDISKFTGNVYTRLGFKCNKDSLTVPNYVWVSPHNEEVLRRYQTQKHKLISKGLGSKEQTEDEIMSSLGYMKIYDSGNLRLIWDNE